MTGTIVDLMSFVKPHSILIAAKEVRGMIAFFSLLGKAARGPDARHAFDVLVSICPENSDWRARAWQLVDGWQKAVDRERKTGWTAEVVAMGSTMNDIADWGRVDWMRLSGKLVQKPTPAS